MGEEERADQREAVVRQQELFTARADESTSPRSADEYDCPGCRRVVRDTYVEGDALCCWCRDINDPRLAPRIRAMRQQSCELADAYRRIAR